ncbi:MAG: hypothetical protein KG003_07985 [Bacteroidetes bacterium]|nr:hypothetical protein [Bacteroidota bacterium]
MSYSESWLDEILKKNPQLKVKEDRLINPPVIHAAPSAQPKGMNKLELRYSYFLQNQFLGGEIIKWMHEPFNLRLANPKCHYKIDFLVINLQMEIELHETKGEWVDGDALVKFKVAAKEFPFFRWKWVTEELGVFVYRELWNGSWLKESQK